MGCCPGWTTGVSPPGYSPAAQEDNINCTSERYFFQEHFLAPNHTKFSCKFTTDMLQNCSGQPDPTFGFAEGKPCFIIKMNRVSVGSEGRRAPAPHPCSPQASRGACSPHQEAASRTRHLLDQRAVEPGAVLCAGRLGKARRSARGGCLRTAGARR